MDPLKRLLGKKGSEPSPQPKQSTAATPPPTPPYDPLPDLPNYDPEPADGVRVGESPVPGLTLRRILRGHTDAIHRIAWSPDGRFLASPSGDTTIRIWDVARGECTAVLEGHRDRVNSVAWSPEGYRLASGSDDSTIHIWDAEIWETLTVLEEHSRPIFTVAWSKNGRSVASGDDRGGLLFWDPCTFRVLNREEIHSRGSGIVTNLAWSPDNRLLAVCVYAEGSENIFLYNAETRQECKTLETKSGFAGSLAWSSDSSNLILGGC